MTSVTMKIALAADGVFVASVPELDGVSATGATPEDAAAKAGQLAVEAFGEMVIVSTTLALAQIQARSTVA